MTEIQKSEMEIEGQIHNLRNSYNEMKKERLKTEKETKLLENKLKLLQAEEMNAFKKFQTAQKYKEEFEQARLKVIELKNQLQLIKDNKSKEINEMHKKIQEKRENVQKSLTEKKKMKFQENRIHSLQARQKKVEIDEIIKNKMEKMKENNKKMVEKIRITERSFSEKRKVLELEKKMKLKMEIEKKTY